MTVPETVLFGDQYYRRVIYSLAAYIADYEEQVLLSGIVRNWCPKCLANRKNLDEDALRRHREHTELIVKELDLRTLWEVYGIDGDIVVCTAYFLLFSGLIKVSHLQANFHVQTSRECFRRTFFINLSRAHSKITWLTGWKSIFFIHIQRALQKKYWIILIKGVFPDLYYHTLTSFNSRIAAVAPFAGLRRFPQGRHFKQWTGDDSKGLMKVLAFLLNDV